MPIDYKPKPEKHKYRINSKTIDEVHKEYLDQFKKNQEAIPEKQKKISKLEKELTDLEKNNDGKPINLDIELLKKRSFLKKSIVALKNEIDKINNCCIQMDYYSKVGDIVYEYYDLTNGMLYGKNFDEEQNEKPNNDNDDNGKICNSTKLEQMHSDELELQLLPKASKIEISDELLAITNFNKTRKLKKPVRKRNKRIETTETKNIMNLLMGPAQSEEKEQSVNNTLCKATLQNEYLVMMDKDYTSCKKQTSLIYRCKKCNLELLIVYDQSIVACPKCGESLEIFIESDVPSQREAFTEKPKYPYKRIGHCIEKLNQFLCKGNANVPVFVFSILEEEIEKHGMTKEDVTLRFLKKMLKKHRLSDYYENIMFIYSKITTTPPLSITREEYELVLELFKAAEEVYEKIYKPKNRNNFLTYTFVLNRIFLKIDRKDIAAHFPLLKNPIKMKEQENIWKKICIALEWN
jgi:hypothetical protein